MYCYLFLILALRKAVNCISDYGRLHSQVKDYPDHDVPLYYGLNTGLNYTERYCSNSREGFEIMIDDNYDTVTKESCPPDTRCECWYNAACKDVNPCRPIPKALPMISTGTFQYQALFTYYGYYSERFLKYNEYGVVKQDGEARMYLQINTLRNGTWRNFELIVPSKTESGTFEKYTGENIFGKEDTYFCHKTKLDHFQAFGYDIPTNILTKSTKLGYNSNKMLQEWYNTMMHDVIATVGVWTWKWTVVADLTKNEMRPLKTYYLADGPEIDEEIHRRTQNVDWTTSRDLGQKLSGHVDWYQELLKDDDDDHNENWFQIPNICM